MRQTRPCCIGATTQKENLSPASQHTQKMFYFHFAGRESKMFPLFFEKRIYEKDEITPDVYDLGPTIKQKKSIKFMRFVFYD